MEGGLVDYGPLRTGRIPTNQAPPRWGPDLTAAFPAPRHPGDVCLEFGCGNGRARPVIESYGYRWVGIDVAGSAMSAKCDGHYLPFAASGFELVVSIAVFEHLYNPFRAAQEVYRVLKPGGTFLGTTAFLEPFHANSYFHMSHLGVQKILTDAGFEVCRQWSTWHFLEALSGFWMPAELSGPNTVVRAAARVVAKSVMSVRASGLRLVLNHKGANPAEIERRIQREYLTWTGGVAFLARKPEGSALH